jgi:ureidoacrylate peracid hydrolase
MNNHIPWEFDKNKAVLLVIDMQNDFVNEGAIMEVPMARQNLPNMKKLLNTCRRHNIPVIFTTHVLYDTYDVSPLEVAYQPWLKKEGMRHGSRGVQVVDELAPLPNEVVIQKHRYDAFYNTQLETVIRNIRGSGVADTVIITGTVTNVCCESTARSAFMRDFKVVFVSDACGGFDEASHQATLNIIGKVFGRVMTTDELIAQIENN